MLLTTHIYTQVIKDLLDLSIHMYVHKRFFKRFLDVAYT